jgi:hypothetical protein
MCNKVLKSRFTARCLNLVSMSKIAWDIERDVQQDLEIKISLE